MTANEFDDWELPEVRDRDRAEPGSERADCCGDAVRFVCEIPRYRHQGVVRFDYSPARFRLCRHHAEILHRSDPRARIYPMPDMK